MACKVKQPTQCSGRRVDKMCNKHYLQLRRHGKVFTSNRDGRPALLDGDVAKIPLGLNARGGYAIVDKECAYLAQDNWRKTPFGYAIRSKDKVLLHRLLLKAQKGQVVDHKDGNPLNNTLSNIRFCTQAENSKNQKIKKNNTSGYKGVYFDKRSNRFVARVKHNYKSYFAGHFESAREGAKAYNNLANKLHGKFARLNNA